MSRHEALHPVLLWPMKELRRDYKFKNFSEAMAFVNEVARIAEARDHHPDILVKYNQVALTFLTHTANAVTDKDLRLAAEVDDLYKSKGNKNLA